MEVSQIENSVLISRADASGSSMLFFQVSPPPAPKNNRCPANYFCSARKCAEIRAIAQKSAQFRINMRTCAKKCAGANQKAVTYLEFAKRHFIQSKSVDLIQHIHPILPKFSENI